MISYYWLQKEVVAKKLEKVIFWSLTSVQLKKQYKVHKLLKFQILKTYFLISTEGNVYKYSITQALFLDEDLETGLKRISKHGYNGVELPMMPKCEYDYNEVRKLLEKYSLDCYSINGDYSGQLNHDLSSVDEVKRSIAIDYVTTCIKTAKKLGADIVVTVPSGIGKKKPDTTLEEAWNKAVCSYKQLGEIAQKENIVLVIEPVNRGETYLINTLDSASSFIEEVGYDSVKILADVFHMNIEEIDMADSIIRNGNYIAHVHIADSNRRAPGMGHMEYESVLKALEKVRYRGNLTMEMDYQQFDDKGRNVITREKPVYDFYCEQAINHMKHQEKLLLEY